MSDKDYTQFIIHKIENGWRVEYRTLNSVHPSVDYPDDASMLAAIKATVETP